MAFDAGHADRLNIGPEVIAHHYTEGAQAEKAIPLWHRAGKRAAERSADVEAHGHLRNALKLIESLPESAQRDEQELELLILLGPVQMNRHGSAAPEVGNLYGRARELCDRVAETARRFPVIWGLWLHHHMAGELETALELAHEAIELGDSAANEDFLLQAHHAAWTSQIALPDFVAAVEHADRGLALYDAERHRSHAFTYGGHDPGVCACMQSGNGRWFLGYPDQAIENCAKARAIAERIEHAFSKAQALATTAQLRLLRREPDEAIEFAEELISFSADNDLRLWRANGEILRAWGLSQMGEPVEVLEGFRDAIRRRQAAGSQLRMSLHLAQLAHALALSEEFAEAETVIGEAFDHMEATRERTWEPIIHWTRGRILEMSGTAGPEAAETSFWAALNVSRRLNARSPELRAATSLAALWLERGQAAEASDLLSPVYHWFREGLETPDLVDARALLNRLGHA